jgi:hypothetical protein
MIIPNKELRYKCFHKKRFNSRLEAAPTSVFLLVTWIYRISALINKGVSIILMLTPFIILTL